MKMITLSKNLNVKNIDSFFSKYNEFSRNQELLEQTTRFLKVLLRHSEPEIVNQITEVENGRSFTVSGSCRTYTIVFEIKKNNIVLKELY